jgi:hypothetical protein
LGRVVEGVLFSDSAVRFCAQRIDFVQDCGDVGDAEFDFDFGVSFFGFRHGDSVVACAGGSQKILHTGHRGKAEEYRRNTGLQHRAQRKPVAKRVGCQHNLFVACVLGW